MEDSNVPALGSVVIQRKGGRLIVVLEHVRVMLHLAHERQFDPMALELDGNAQLPAWVTTADVAEAASHPAGRT